MKKIKTETTQLFELLPDTEKRSWVFHHIKEVQDIDLAIYLEQVGYPLPTIPMQTDTGPYLFETMTYLLRYSKHPEKVLKKIKQYKIDLSDKEEIFTLFSGKYLHGFYGKDTKKTFLNIAKSYLEMGGAITSLHSKQNLQGLDQEYQGQFSQIIQKIERQKNKDEIMSIIEPKITQSKPKKSIL